VVEQGPRADNGILYLGPWDDLARAFATARWSFGRAVELAPNVTRIDLSTAPGSGARPGFEDREGLMLLSATGPKRLAAGFFCDADAQAEGVRVFEGGRERPGPPSGRVLWARAQPPDPVAWPLGMLAMSFSLPLEKITRVARPPRPALAVALEALLNGETPSSPELRQKAVQLLGTMDHPRVTDVLVAQLKSDDWVTRFHAVRAYTRKHRRPGQDGRPPLDALLGDADEGVREAALKGIAELLPDVAYSDKDLHAQIDRAIARGLADADDDVKAAAAQAQALRKKLLG
jgi:hypothetical protein